MLITTLEELEPFAASLINTYPNIRVILLRGNLGAGKTAFTKAFCKIMGVTTEVSSPTFALVQEYQGKARIYHFDLYRIKNEDELFGIGFEEYFKEEGYKLIEWPDIALNLIDDDFITINFDVLENNHRVLSIQV